VPSTASPALVAEWRRFEAALGTHELGHRDIAVRGAQQLVDAVRKLRGSTCEAVHRAAEYAARDVSDVTRTQQLSYDNLTNHGLSQGTLLRAVP
jgi:predicted secreted Zn-dependent protease